MKTRHIIIFLFILILVGLVFIFLNDMKILSIILVTTSGLAVIIALIYEGELKAKKEEKKLLNLTGIGLFLFLLFILSTLSNGVVSYKSILDNETNSIQDSITSYKIISDLKKQREADSINILNLNKQIASIDTTLIKNTLKELDEQRKAVERERENICKPSLKCVF